ncbi:hypothetical protein [Thermogymnomonas acidicola]|uniref:phosphopantothenoylcysteine decarboxylase domain-containing protein n=1 Tax=Thermogymnomonas acidicola TaxID=399579 RepID=UPI00094674CD|nr:phosphopantothenoylcysteine decarboxylase [Thermogymnomonas acidicola]
MRVVTNRSTGLMGVLDIQVALQARCWCDRIRWQLLQAAASYVNFRPAHTAEEFEEGVSEAMRSAQFDGVFLCAALPDFTLDRHHSKIPSSSEVTLKLTPPGGRWSRP